MAELDCVLPPRMNLMMAATTIKPRKSSIGNGMLANSRVQDDDDTMSIATCCLRSSGINEGSPKSGTRLRNVLVCAVPLTALLMECLKRPSISVPLKVTLAILPASS